MEVYSGLRAQYSRGSLELQEPLDLPDGTEVSVRVTVLPAGPKNRPRHYRPYLYPNRSLSLDRLDQLTGVVSLGGDALADSEAIYDEQ